MAPKKNNTQQPKKAEAKPAVEPKKNAPPPVNAVWGKANIDKLKAAPVERAPTPPPAAKTEEPKMNWVDEVPPPPMESEATQETEQQAPEDNAEPVSPTTGKKKKARGLDRLKNLGYSTEDIQGIRNKHKSFRRESSSQYDENVDEGEEGDSAVSPKYPNAKVGKECAFTAQKQRHEEQAEMERAASATFQ